MSSFGSMRGGLSRARRSPRARSDPTAAGGDAAGAGQHANAPAVCAIRHRPSPFNRRTVAATALRWRDH
ncbi:hypothetical protein SERN_2176 [Serinibacter arcticus]|uniref:Uncharacterized protein n=1 Tax=Serinibacter arcticus TaxID=1655435 RepID=A0A4Z1E254_9MICO|nr:hypothetical protein SERN_2176 [Serinibacter arcticus]